MHTIIGHGKNGRGIAAILRALDLRYEIYDIRPEISTLDSIEEAKGLVHVCAWEREVPEIVRNLDKNQQVDEILIHSTMPVGSTRKIANSAARCMIAYMPMFFRERQPETDVLIPNRIVLGADENVDCDRIFRFITAYMKLVGIAPLILSYEGAEIVKLATNSMRANMISFFNELYQIATEHSKASEFRDVILQSELLKPTNVLDIWETETGWGRNPALIGQEFGGACLPKDTEYLKIRTGRKDFE